MPKKKAKPPAPPALPPARPFTITLDAPPPPLQKRLLAIGVYLKLDALIALTAVDATELEVYLYQYAKGDRPTLPGCLRRAIRDNQGGLFDPATTHVVHP